MISYTFDEFYALVKKGPGFGCWKDAQILSAWGKRKTVTAKTLARFGDDLDDIVEYLESVMLCLLTRSEWIRLYKILGINGAPPLCADDANTGLGELEDNSFEDVRAAVRQL